ncbi:MAG TPA: GxxExxY protein [Burkholderiales bacterium]|nr:GxxExxY protein [Burkholderiales bacterium]
MKDDLTEKIISAAIEVHRILGPGLLESIYEEALCHELVLRQIDFQRQVAVNVVYKDLLIQGQRLDLLVENEVVVEIKSIGKLPEVATAQTLSYLKATGLKRALLINFGDKRLVDGIKRISL